MHATHAFHTCMPHMHATHACHTYVTCQQDPYDSHRKAVVALLARRDEVRRFQAKRRPKARLDEFANINSFDMVSQSAGY